MPEWVNLNVAGMTPTTTIIEILACGRFTSNDEFLYHIPAGLPPFQVGGPTLPLEWVEGQRFSIHYHSKCASPDELEAMRPHGAKPWSLDLEGAVATDDTLLALPDLPNLEILELHDSKLRGPGLSALARFPKLRILRVHGVDDAVDVSDGPKLKRWTKSRWPAFRRAPVESKRGRIAFPHWSGSRSPRPAIFTSRPRCPSVSITSP